MGLLKGFPTSNQLTIGERTTKNNVKNKEIKITKSGLIGFASKGPINEPILIKDLRQYYSIFGHPSMEGDSYMTYAAEQCLLAGEVYVYRAANLNLAKTASIPIPGANNLVKTHSSIKEPYVFNTNQFFRWKLNGVLSPKTLVVLAGDGITAAQLADELNDQLTPKDGIHFYVHNGEYIAVRTTLKNKSELEIVSIAATKIFGFDNDLVKNSKEFFGSSSSDDISFTVYADSPGIEGNSTRVTIVNDPDSDTFSINVHNNGIQVESWCELTKDIKSRFYVESFINLFSEWIRVVDNPKNILPPKNGTYLLGDERITDAIKGSDGIPADVIEQEKLIVGNSTNMSGLYAFLDKSACEIDFLAAPGFCTDKVAETMALISEKRADCIAIIDPPMELSAEETGEWIKCKSNAGAIFWPWVKIRDTYNRINTWVPPSGSVIAAIARSDVLLPSWSFPTTPQIVPGVLDVFSIPSNEEKKFLNDHCVVNPILYYKCYGNFAVNMNNVLNKEKIANKILLIYIEKNIAKTIDTLIADHDLLPNETLKKRIEQICDHMLRQIKDTKSIYSYVVRTDIDMLDENKGFRVKVMIGIKIKKVDKEAVINLDFEQPMITNTTSLKKEIDKWL